MSDAPDQFARTIAALKAWDDAWESRAMRHATAAPDEIERVRELEKQEADVVREAFWLDTAAYNTREQAFWFHPDLPMFRSLFQDAG